MIFIEAEGATSLFFRAAETVVGSGAPAMPRGRSTQEACAARPCLGWPRARLVAGIHGRATAVAKRAEASARLRIASPTAYADVEAVAL